MPVCSTNKIPCKASRSGRRLRPGNRKRRSTFGNNGSIRSHNASDTIHGATDTGTLPSLTTGADGFAPAAAVPSYLRIRKNRTLREHEHPHPHPAPDTPISLRFEFLEVRGTRARITDASCPLAGRMGTSRLRPGAENGAAMLDAGVPKVWMTL